MAQIFNSFAQGLETGTAARENRERRNALEQAGRLYSTGEFDAAENALISAGLPQEAGNYSALAEASRARTNRRAVAEAMTGLDPNASPDERLSAGAGAALQAGDVDQWATLTQFANTLTEQQRGQHAQRAQWIGSAAASLLDVPVEQRAAQAQRLLAASPYANDESIMAMIDETTELSDDALTAAAQNSMTAAEILGMRRQENQFNRQMAAQERQFQRSLNPSERPLTNTERRVLANEYRGAQEGVVDQLGILRPSLPYARLAISRGGDTRNVQGVNFRQADVALLRAAARAQTGPGVLTESEVFSTLSPSLQQDLLRNRAYLSISEAGIAPQDRAALAQFVMQSAGNIQRDAWDLYDSYAAAWGQEVLGQNGMQPPRLPHPEDEGALQSRERHGAVVGREYVGGGGRTYRYLGPGQWEFSRMGEATTAPTPSQPTAESIRQPAIDWGQISSDRQAEAVRRVRANPALLPEFQRQFNLTPEQAQRLINGAGAPQSRPDGPMVRG